MLAQVALVHVNAVRQDRLRVLLADAGHRIRLLRPFDLLRPASFAGR